MTDREFWLRVQRRAVGMEPDIAREYLRGFEELRRSLSRAELERLIRSGALDRILAGPLDDAAIEDVFRGLRVEIQRTMREAVLSAARDTPGPGVGFNVLDTRILVAMDALDTRVMRTLSDEVRATFVAEVRAGLEAGVGPRTIANRSIETIGLAPNQAAYVRNFRAELQRGDRAALRRMLQRGVLKRPDGSILTNRYHAQGAGLTARQVAMLDAKLGKEPLSAAQIDRLVKSYEKRLIAWNVETNARTASIDAMKRAQRLNWEDAISRGLVKRETLYRRWTAVGGKLGDGRNREEHLAMHGEERHIDSAYSNGQVVPGGDEFNCRCGERWFIRRAA